MDTKRYVGERRRLLKEEMKLVIERDRLSRLIIQLRKEMITWDRALMQEE